MLKALCHFLYLSFVLYTTKSRKLFYKSAAYAFTYLQHFLQAVYFFFAWLSGMLFGFFIPEQLGLLWYFLLLRSTYTVVSPVCWLTLGGIFIDEPSVNLRVTP